jgi:hypothetical protein
LWWPRTRFPFPPFSGFWQAVLVLAVCYLLFQKSYKPKSTDALTSQVARACAAALRKFGRDSGA